MLQFHLLHLGLKLLDLFQLGHVIASDLSKLLSLRTLMINGDLMRHSSWKLDVGLSTHWASERWDLGIWEELPTICVVVWGTLNHWVIVSCFCASYVVGIIVARWSIILVIPPLYLRVVVGVLQRLRALEIWGVYWLDLSPHEVLVLSLLLVHHKYLLIYMWGWLQNIDGVRSGVGTKVLVYSNGLIWELVFGIVSSTLLWGWNDIW